MLTILGYRLWSRNSLFLPQKAQSRVQGGRCLSQCYSRENAHRARNTGAVGEQEHSGEVEESRAALGRDMVHARHWAWNCILGFEEHKLLGQDVNPESGSYGQIRNPGGLDLETRRRFSGF